MKALSIAKNALMKGALVAQKVGPDAMVYFGMVGIAVATVMIVKKADEVDDILDEHKDRVDQVRAEAKDDKERRKGMAKAYAKTGKDVVRTFGPVATLYFASATCILGGHNIVRKRYAGTAAAYKVLEESFDGYRSRVKEAVGEEKEKDLYLGRKKQDITVKEIAEDGTEVEKTIKDAYVVDGLPSPYAKFFDKMSREWQDNLEYNLMFLRQTQNYFNHVLQANGHVFLNEVYDALDIPRTSEGAVVGWVKGAGDDFIDFGIYDLYNDASREFVNGYTQSILLDFNVDGPIWNKI